ncbi:uncharacterized protein [Dysidea avara]|uniref:uncharacterized protein isoform X2 n=1 Tax=Dysidea avara TaxID=196820 RepID=UPI00333431B3
METCEKKRSLTFSCSSAGSFTRIKRRNFEVYSSVKDPTNSAHDEQTKVKTLRFNKKKRSIAATMNQDLFDRFSQVFSDDKQILDISSFLQQPELCSNCKMGITNNDKVVVLLDSKLYHTCCFQCVHCDNKINPRVDYLLLESGKPLCSTCVPECHACGEIILAKHVRVVDKDFHEKCLSCTYCRMSLFNKVYAREGELCCAKCVVPVFSEEWSHLSAVTAGNGHVSKAATVPLATPKDRVIKIGRRSVCLNPKLLSLSKNITTITKSTRAAAAAAANNPVPRLNSLIKPSFEVSTSSLAATSTEDKFGISSLSCILCDEVGSTLLLNFCVCDNSVEWVVFWLDVEHYKHFDGSRDDLKLLANCIIIKYMADMAEIPVDLPGEMVEKITKEIELNTTQDIFDEAQQYVYAKMEETVWDRFLRSEDGQNYLEILVSRDIQRKRKRESADGFAGRNIMATVKTFDKRHSSSKYYVSRYMKLMWKLDQSISPFIEGTANSIG